MNSLIKFWIASSLVIALLAWWPLNHLEEWARNSSSARQQTENRMLEEARLLEDFLLDDNPAGKGRAASPKVWENALKARIFLRESPGEAVGQIGGAKDQMEEIARLQPGMGVLIENDRGSHFIYDTERSGKGQFLVISKEKTKDTVKATATDAPPSALAFAIALGIVGGGLITLLAKVALLAPKKAT